MECMLYESSEFRSTWVHPNATVQYKKGSDGITSLIAQDWHCINVTHYWHKIKGLEQVRLNEGQQNLYVGLVRVASLQMVCVLYLPYPIFSSVGKLDCWQ